MDQATFEIIKLIVQLVIVGIVIIGTKVVIPWIKQNVEESKIESVRRWAETFVLMAEQVFGDKPGPERKAIVTKRLKDILLQKNISLTDQQISDLIEAAVKAMKIAEVTVDVATTINNESATAAETAPDDKEGGA